jgi:hypothetical protein
MSNRKILAQTPEKSRHLAGFNRAWVHSGAARKGWPPASFATYFLEMSTNEVAMQSP